MTSCIETTWPRTKDGYGRTTTETRAEARSDGRTWRRSRYAHIAAWEEANGPVPDGLEICHSCGNPPCINLDHLYAGTHQQNMQDMMCHGRATGQFKPGVGYASRSKLTEDAVQDIRRRYAEKAATQQELADEYRVSAAHISRVVNRLTWNHI